MTTEEYNAAASWSPCLATISRGYVPALCDNCIRALALSVETISRGYVPALCDNCIRALALTDLRVQKALDEARGTAVAPTREVRTGPSMGWDYERDPSKPLPVVLL